MAPDSTFSLPATPKNVLALVLAGGEGTRLRPLTMMHAKPALSFGGGLRLVDFVLSNLVNSGIDCIYVLAQYQPDSLIKHIDANWKLSANGHERFVRVVLPQKELGGVFRGTADAVYQNLELIKQHKPDIVAVFAAGQVYRMDVRQMVNYHNQTGADVTIAASQIPIEQASSHGIIAADYRGEVWDYQENPDVPIAIYSNPDMAYASMGNYLFNADVLATELEWSLRCGETDFGMHVLPHLLHTHQVHAYDFASNIVPGTHPHEQRAYWRDVGTLEAYVNARRDIIGHSPRFNLNNPQWPILPASLRQQHAPASNHFQPFEEIHYGMPAAVSDTFLNPYARMRYGNS